MIEVEHVSKRYGTTNALKDVSLRVGDCQCVALLGPSGAGKSTLLRCLAGLESLTSGSVRVRGALVHPHNSFPDGLGYVSQQLSLWPFRTVLENVTEGLRFGRKPVKVENAVDVSMEWLRRLRVSQYAKKYPHEISGGEQQRVALARALVLAPTMLVLDEPTTGLDPVTSGEIAEVLNELKQAGTSLLIASHQIDFLKRVSTFGYFLLSGAIHESGVTSEMLESPKTTELKDFIARVRLGW